MIPSSDSIACFSSPDSSDLMVFATPQYPPLMELLPIGNPICWWIILSIPSDSPKTPSPSPPNLRHQPSCLNKSEANIHNKLKFYMKDLGYTSSYLAICTSFFTLSLDKRVIPRNMMLKILKEKRLVNNDKPSLITIACFTEFKFLEFLRGFEDQIPSFREIYLDNVRRVS
ncbi:uncharacterized protein LOC112510429 [Cynara cardunculus var. scolymus]|uniref:Mitochodrial transcription termination factor-related protein n=1 Tax=Cynara cardunculus var. scolymus TaxID=59895 RepID=A0A103YDR3_CYNCS|nr:uncharacterized protein LOC112510429 [Cynara cardunculus var. scolymus]KVI07225.1 Mitochodrial transcription termination factor-related protein [Cynara cardunculus var. scolymus]